MTWPFSPSPSKGAAITTTSTAEASGHDHSHNHATNSDPSHSHSHSHSQTASDRKSTTSSNETPLLPTKQQDHQDDDAAAAAKRQQDMVMRRLQIASLLCASFLIIEVVGGWLAGSLAVLSDAAHLFADLASFAVAMGASHLANLPSTDQHTFGLKRMESLAALFSMVSLALVSVGLAVEAIRRLLEPDISQVDGPLMSGIALIGVLVNVVLAFVLGEHHVHMPGASHDHSHNHSHSHNHHDHDEEQCGGHVEEQQASAAEGGYGAVAVHQDELLPPTQPRTKQPQRNINLQAAYLHVMGDLLQSVAVLIAGLVIWARPSWHVVDPICTLLFCALVFYSTLSVLRSSISVLLEEVPPHLSWMDIHQEIEAVENVTHVHDLHIWSISHGIPTLSVHCMATAGSDPQCILSDVYRVCQKYGIVHATVQIQCGGDENECITCSGNPIGGLKCNTA